MNRWPDPEYKNAKDGGFEATPEGADYYLKRGSGDESGTRIGMIDVTPGMVLRVGMRVDVVEGPPAQMRMHFYDSTFGGFAWKNAWAPNLSQLGEFASGTYTIPTGMTKMTIGLFSCAPYATAATLMKISDVTVGGGLGSEQTQASDQVTLQVLPTPNNVRLYYLKQASNLAAPMRPTANPPASPWTTTEPTYTEGSTDTVYTTMLTVWGDASYQYGDVQKSAAFEAAKQAFNKAIAAGQSASSALTAANKAADDVANLQIGGRNLLRNYDVPTSSAS